VKCRSSVPAINSPPTKSSASEMPYGHIIAKRNEKCGVTFNVKGRGL
jgi:hypothetical protein